MARYRVIGSTAVLGHKPGEEFYAELRPEQQYLADRHLLELPGDLPVPKRRRPTKPRKPRATKE